ncbi:hypothetical protein CAPTEDRAFT_192382 [Capitella teleta]|uniref:Endonuclease/exonuclease/phosphatase domain-containing protein n=1 Tax=Capitella teleta TaxID=283909 RepID=R7TU97_CAPTE|nr:hypothetical protein CAPTEDRAFT_192382 [Capitella teleta]|eukprot:ELT97244.1 hypothetical protein CAPTEDRAFT_192382 [Capitella teleta]
MECNSGEGGFRILFLYFFVVDGSNKDSEFLASKNILWRLKIPCLLAKWQVNFFPYFRALMTGETKQDIKHGVRFIVRKKITNSVISCTHIPSRMIAIRLEVKPLIVNIIQVYAHASVYEDNEVKEFYKELDNIIKEIFKKDTLIVQGDWNAKKANLRMCNNYCTISLISPISKIILRAILNRLAKVYELPAEKQALEQKEVLWSRPSTAASSREIYSTAKDLQHNFTDF